MIRIILQLGARLLKVSNSTLNQRQKQWGFLCAHHLKIPLRHKKWSLSACPLYNQGDASKCGNGGTLLYKPITAALVSPKSLGAMIPSVMYQGVKEQIAGGLWKLFRQFLPGTRLQHSNVFARSLFQEHQSTLKTLSRPSGHANLQSHHVKDLGYRTQSIRTSKKSTVQ